MSLCAYVMTNDADRMLLKFHNVIVFTGDFQTLTGESLRLEILSFLMLVGATDKIISKHFIHALAHVIACS